ncbi:MAG: dihydropteridine reductase [Clostridia bacterium]|nr:dihydropteridine reductase [Clostridia bacterium]
MNDKEFKYTYSAPSEEERREIEGIRNQYTPKEKPDDKLTRLKKLHARVSLIPIIVALTLGVIGTLVFGLGLSLILVWKNWTVGIILSIVGFIIAVMAYPLHALLIRHLKDKYGKEILELSDELLNNE